ncbi:hypothetical protein Tco_0912802 [Tanacetum coccineum]
MGKSKGFCKLKGMEDNSRARLHNGRVNYVKSRALIDHLSIKATWLWKKAQGKVHDKERELETKDLYNRETHPGSSYEFFFLEEGSKIQREGVRLRRCPKLGWGMVEINFEGGRPSGLGADNNRIQRKNLPPLLAAHLERSENGQGFAIPLNYPPYAQNGNPSFGGTFVQYSQGSQKVGSILNYEDLKAKFWLHFSQQKKITKTHVTVHNIKQREGESTRAFVTRSLVEFLSTDLPTTYKGLMEKTYTSIEARDVATNGAPNDRREGFNKSKKNPSWDNNKGQENRDRFSSYCGSNHGLLSNLSKSPKEILATEKASLPSSDPVIIKAKISGRQVNRVHMDIESSCEVIYEHCFLKLKPSIKSLGVDSKVSLIGFSREHSSPIGEVPLEITKGDSPFSRTETLNFVIIRPNSSHNLLLRRTAMQKIGIVVSTIHRAIKFYTPREIGIVFSTYEFGKMREGTKKMREVSSEDIKGILSCTDAEERIIINRKYPELTL